VYTAGKLIFFDPFYFKTGDNKPKFFLVVKVLKERVLLASLPSSKAHLPAAIEIVHGCLEIKDSGINCRIKKHNRLLSEFCQREEKIQTNAGIAKSRKPLNR
jgi:hypothetical protein